MSIKQYLKKIGFFFRKPVLLNDFMRDIPISRLFGTDRGTPIDRYYIENFIKRNSHLVKGHVLEVGDNHYTKLYGGSRVQTSEVFHVAPGNSSATIVGDLTNTATLHEDWVDCFICTQTFHQIYEVQEALRGAHYLLKPNGVLLATFPGISQIARHDMDNWGDYWRFTTASIKRLLEPIFKGAIEIESYGNVLSATAFLQAIALEDLPDLKLLDNHDPDYQMIITVLARKAP